MEMHTPYKCISLVSILFALALLQEKLMDTK
jgi:hypothetical protein